MKNLTPEEIEEVEKLTEKILIVSISYIRPDDLKNKSLLPGFVSEDSYGVTCYVIDEISFINHYFRDFSKNKFNYLKNLFIIASQMKISYIRFDVDGKKLDLLHHRLISKEHFKCKLI